MIWRISDAVLPAVGRAVVALIIAAVIGGIWHTASTATRAKEQLAATQEALVKARGEAQRLRVDLSAAKELAATDADALTRLSSRNTDLARLASTLNERLSHVRLVAGDARDRGAADHAAETPRGAVAPGIGTNDGGPWLTAGAVRLWNDALRGDPGAIDPVSGRSCGADETGRESCAADTDATAVTIDDAWRNHVDNAVSCAADRARLDELIDAVKRRQARQNNGQMP